MLPMFTFPFPSVILNGAPEQCFLHSILQRAVKDPRICPLPCSIREFSPCIFVEATSIHIGGCWPWVGCVGCWFCSSGGVVCCGCGLVRSINRGPWFWS